jgi:hydrogenase-4 component E
MLYIFAASRLDGFIKTLALQGVLLFLLVLTDIHHMNWINVGFLCVETLVVKAVLIPWLLMRVIRQNEMGREIEPHFPQFHSLLIGTLVFVFGFVVSHWIAKTETVARPLNFGVSIALIIGSLYLIINRKRIITHILCYMLLENGIFLLSISTANEMPMLINMGVLLDLFMGIYLLVVFHNKIQAMYDGNHIDVLTELKD